MMLKMMPHVLLFALVTFSAFYSAADESAADETLKVYHDSDYSNHSQSANAIKMGFLTALSEADNTLAGRKVEFVEKDHRGNSNRSLLHMKQFLKDDDALFILGGLHSPPYIKNRKFINEQGVLLLVPWAAGGPITRYPSENNWVFRLSIDDTKAGFKLIESAKRNECHVPHLLLEDTPWGKSNYNTMSKALRDKKPSVTWFNWNTKDSAAKVMIGEILDNNADCIIFVGNAIEGNYFINALASFPEKERLPVFSHWGITGGSFFQKVEPILNQGLSLSFLQSCFSFQSKPLSPFSEAVLERAKGLFPEYFASKNYIEAASGFIHGYDLGLLVIEAAKKLTLSDNAQENRTALRVALENLDKPVQGLVKTYTRPFSKWSKKHPDAHEALSIEDFCMGQYQNNGSIKVLK